MNARRTVLIVVAAILLVLSMESCNLLGVQIEDRVYMFVDDINNAPGSVYLNFHPDTSITVNYDLMKPALYWTSYFPAPPPDYTITTPSVVGNVATTWIDGPAGFSGPRLLVFTMALNGSDWYIEKLTLDGALIAD